MSSESHVPTEPQSGRKTQAGAAPFVAKWTSSLEIPPSLTAILRPHQVDALHFIWKKLVDEGVLYVAARSNSCTVAQRLDLLRDVHGCILGHSMGLGKTLTTLTFVLLLQAQLWLMTLKRSLIASSGSGPQPTCRALRVIVLCPLSCIPHWKDTVDEWLRPELFGRVKLPIYVPSAGSGGLSASMPRYNATLKSFYEEGGVLLLGYEEFIHYAARLAESPAGTKGSPRVLSALDAIRARVPLPPTVTLLDMLESADLLILDEAHRVRGHSSTLTTALTRHMANTQLRLALTGTPIQNHLEDYNVMQSVVTGRLLDMNKFRKHFVAPIERGQCSDSTFAQFKEMQKCVASLRVFFADTVHHGGPELLEAALPPRHEHVFFLRLSDTQEKAYRALVEHFKTRICEKNKSAITLTLYHQSSHLCLHPCLVTTALDTSSEPASPAGQATMQDSDTTVDADSSEDEVDDEVGEGVADTWMNAPDTIDVSLSPKLMFTLALVRHIIQDRHEKVVIYSRYISHITLICTLVQRDLNVVPLVLTGRNSGAERQYAISTFQEDATRSVLAASVGAGGVGIKLTAANHCILLDVGWNPANDAQATYRIFRFGQTRPVYVYRLAGFGTCEHVVFAYALQKLWVHRKLADVADPQRHAQHIKQNYLVYPCVIPLEGESRPEEGDAVVDESMPAHKNTGGAASQTRAERALKVCDEGCSPAAATLRRTPALQPYVETVVPHSFLLRDTTDEVISAMNARFSHVEQKKASQTMVVAAPVLPSAPVSRPTQSLFQQCEPAVADVAHEAANYCILHLIQQDEEARHRERCRDASRQEEEEGQKDSAAVVRTTDARLRQALAPLLPAVLPGPLKAPLRAAPFLAETFLGFYAVGVHLVVERLQATSYTKLRTLLSSRIPFDGQRRNHEAGHHGVLEQTLATRPSKVFSGMRRAEETYMCTELGFRRPFVKECIVLGLLHGCLSQEMSEESWQAILQLFPHNGPTESEAETSSAAQDDASLRFMKLEGETRYDAPTQAAHAHMSTFFEGLWPSFVEFYPPLIPIVLKAEKRFTEQAFALAKERDSQGLLTLKEVSAELLLKPFQGRKDQLSCGRCRGAALRRVGPTELSCPLCHYNAEFEAANCTRWYHQVFLYRLSVVTETLASVSLTRAFAEALTDVADAAQKRDKAASARRSLALAERLSRTDVPAAPFAEKCLTEGVAATFAALPPSLTMWLSLQCGASVDISLLEEVLVANAHVVWVSSARPHVKSAVTAALHRACGVSSGEQLPGGSTMPSMMMVAGLYAASAREGIHHAHELLHDTATRSPRHTLLRLLCDGLVAMLFLDALQDVLAEERAQALAQAKEESNIGTPRSSLEPSLHSDKEEGEVDRVGMAEEERDIVSRAPSFLEAFDLSDGSDSEDSTRGLLPMPTSGLAGARHRPGEKRVRNERPIVTRAKRRYDVASSSSSSSISPGRDSRSDSLDSFAPHQFSDDATANNESDDGHDESSTTDTSHAGCLERSFRSARVNAYWLAYCQVYGTESAEQVPVYIDDGPGGLILLPAPPSNFWTVHVSRLPGEGMTIDTAIRQFYHHLIPLLHGVRVIE